VEEVNVEDITGNWTGTGEIIGSGDDEKVELNVGEYMELSSPWNIGSGTARIILNKYVVGDVVTVKYKSGATSEACVSDTWHNYTIPFNQDGWVLIRLEK